MLIDTNLTIAYKCFSCGSFEFFNISLFKLLHKKECSFSCRCKKSSITITEEENGFLLKTPCIGCGNEHTYMLNKKSILSRELNVFNCPETGIQQAFLGKDSIVRKKVDRVEEELDEIIDMYGYESYFKNTQVMLDSLNRIHDIAAKGNLLCSCGSLKIRLVLLPDKILLKCADCGTNNIIHAASNEDLKQILTKQDILISNKVECATGKPDNILHNTDRK